jgi:hypothetical protein
MFNKAGRNFGRALEGKPVLQPTILVRMNRNNRMKNVCRVLYVERFVDFDNDF